MVGKSEYQKMGRSEYQQIGRSEDQPIRISEDREIECSENWNLTPESKGVRTAEIQKEREKCRADRSTYELSIIHPFILVPQTENTTSQMNLVEPRSNSNFSTAKGM